MAGLNKIMVIGNVGRDPEMRYAPSGNAVTSFSVAVSRVFTTQGERKEETEWFQVECWNKLAETANQYVTKGKKLYVEGRLKSDNWTGQDGVPRFRNKIIASDMQFLDRAPSRGEEAPVGAIVDAGGIDPEDLPF